MALDSPHGRRFTRGANAAQCSFAFHRKFRAPQIDKLNVYDAPLREADASHSISLVAWLERKVERVQSIVEPVQKRSCFDIGKQRSWRRRQNANRAVVLAEPVQ
jgi:hypothetical protein